MGLEDKLVGQNLVVEAQLYGGSNNKNNMTYFGTYAGISDFGNENALVLKDAKYRNKDYDFQRETWNSMSLVIIPVKNIISVGVANATR